MYDLILLKRIGGYMYINNVVRSTFSAIQNIENKGDNFKISLNSVILVCYNTIVSFKTYFK